MAVMRTQPGRWLGPVLALGPVLFGVWPVVAARRDYPLVTLIASALPWVLVAGAFAFMTPIAVWATTRRIAKQDPSARGLQTRTLDAAGFHSTGNGVALELPWHAIERCTETDEFFLFYYTKQLAYYLGKSHLTEQQRVSVRALIETHSVRTASTHT